MSKASENRDSYLITGVLKNLFQGCLLYISLSQDNMLSENSPNFSQVPDLCVSNVHTGVCECMGVFVQSYSTKSVHFFKMTQTDWCGFSVLTSSFTDLSTCREKGLLQYPLQISFRDMPNKRPAKFKKHF